MTQPNKSAMDQPDAAFYELTKQRRAQRLQDRDAFGDVFSLGLRALHKDAGALKRLTQFINTRSYSFPEPNIRWRHVKQLGSGSFGTASLWLKLDAKDRIVDRMVLKVVKLNKQMYNNPSFYYKLSGTRDTGPGMPREVYCQFVCGEPTPKPNEKILRLRAYTKQGFPYYWWRLYMEYAPFGDLDDLMGAYKDPNKRYIGPKGPREDRELPVPFLWSCFESLAKAACTMQNPPNFATMGQPDPNFRYVLDKRHLNQAQGGGSEVVHKDLKLSNVFLAEPDPQRFPIYPQIKIGDFGSGRLTDLTEDISINPGLFSGDADPVTPGFVPPEIDFAEGFPRRPGDTHKAARKAAAWTNIWQIGKIMRTLMFFEQEGNVPTDVHKKAWIPEKDNWLSDLKLDYKPTDDDPVDPMEDMRALVKECLRTDPKARITPQRLLEETRRGVTRHAQDWVARTNSPSSNPNRLHRLHRLERRANSQGGRIKYASSLVQDYADGMVLRKQP